MCCECFENRPMYNIVLDGKKMISTTLKVFV